MSQLLCPVFGEWVWNAAAVGGWLFILALIASAWWERRQLRLLRQQAKGQFVICRTTPLRAFLKKFRKKLLLVGVVLVVFMTLLRIRVKSAVTRQHLDGGGDLSGYATNFQGDMTFSASVVKHSENNLWNGPLLKAKTLNFNLDTNLFEKQGSNQAGGAGFPPP